MQNSGQVRYSLFFQVVKIWLQEQVSVSGVKNADDLVLIARIMRCKEFRQRPYGHRWWLAGVARGDPLCLVEAAGMLGAARLILR